MEESVNLYISHPNVKTLDEGLKYLRIEALKNDFNFVWNSETPDYYIATEHILFSNKYKKDFLQHVKSPIKISFFRELYMPDFNLFDYATGFYDRIVCDDRYAPLSTAGDQYYDWIKESKNNIKTNEQALVELQKKNKFCNFLYSNPYAHPMRDKCFYELSKYKHVDSLGRWLNNVETKGTGFAGHKMDATELKRNYKFSIAFENAVCNGYTTEKLLTSLMAHTVPLYFGDPEIENYINPKCFINCNNLSFEEILEKVKTIDNDDKLWAEIVSEPWQTPMQIEYTTIKNKKYLDFWKNIFSQDIKDAKRLAVGFHPDNYLEWYKKSSPIFEQSTLYKVFRKLKTIIRRMK